MRFDFNLLIVSCTLFIAVGNVMGQAYPLPGISDGFSSNSIQPNSGYPLPSAINGYQNEYPLVQQTFTPEVLLAPAQPITGQHCPSCGFADTYAFDSSGRCRNCGIGKKVGQIQNHVPSSTYLYDYLNSRPTPRFDTPSIGPFSTGGTPCFNCKGGHFGLHRR